MAGTVATTLCAPADVLKSRMQSSSGQNVCAIDDWLIAPADDLEGLDTDNKERTPRGGSSISDEGMDACVVTVDVSATLPVLF